MRSGPATLHMFCGKIATGKSTFASRLSQAHDTVLLSEDHFLSKLYPGEITTKIMPDAPEGSDRPSDRTSSYCSPLHEWR